MSFPKSFSLLAIFGATSVAQAQNAVVPDAPSQIYTTVDAFGNVIRSQAPDAALQANGGTSNVVSSDRNRHGRDGNDRDRDDKIRLNNGYYVPGNYVGGYYNQYPYYGAPAYNNNYYYPAVPTTTVLTRPAQSWATPSTITSIPLGNNYYGGYPAYPYPCSPYPAYPAPVYGYPAPAYGYQAPTYGYPALPYPYGTTTTIYGAGNGTIFSQSQTGGYGFSLGNGGLSVQLGNQRSTSTTTVSRY